MVERREERGRWTVDDNGRAGRLEIAEREVEEAKKAGVEGGRLEDRGWDSREMRANMIANV